LNCRRIGPPGSGPEVAVYTDTRWRMPMTNPCCTRRRYALSIVLSAALAASVGCTSSNNGRRDKTNNPEVGGTTGENDSSVAPESGNASDAGLPDAGGSCGAPLVETPAVRPSSFRKGGCDFGEASDFTTYDLLCSPQTPCGGQQTGDQRCHRICDDGKCAEGETCKSRPVYVSDTPTRYANLCLCTTDRCPERGPDATPWPPEGGLESWRAETPMPVDLYYHAAAASADRIFVSGGLTIREILSAGSLSLDTVDAVYSAATNPDGTLSAWSLAGKLPAPVTNHAMAALGGRLYVAGGAEDSNRAGNAFSTSVASAAIQQDGRLGEWRSETPLPAPRGWLSLIAEAGRLLVVGGSTSRAQFTQGSSDVLIAALGADGLIDAWRSTKAPVPVFFEGGAGVVDGRLTVVGPPAAMYSIAVSELADPGIWRSETLWPVANDSMLGPGLGANSGPVHLFDLCGVMADIGRNGQVASAPVDAAGRVGTWRPASGVYNGPQAGYAMAQTPAGRLYMLGGTSVAGATRNNLVWSTERRREP
ncbi:MAG TPA: hypothetical protein VF518_01220, partial [Polyangia bacterium]